jgi:hypothetical protein
MRCAHCGSTIRHEPFYENGMVFCSLECIEECVLVDDDGSFDEEPATEIHGLFGADDDDDY